MKRILISSIVAVALFIVPSMAQAHSGEVTCDSKGVLFTYNANFATAKTSTEHVGDAVYTFNVTPNVVNTHLVPLPVTSPVTVSATWGGPGSIAPRALSCPVATPPVPPTTPSAPVCPPNTVNEGMSGGVLVCVRTVTNTVSVQVPTLPATIPPVFYKCPKGTKLVAYKSGATICLKYRNKIKIITITKVKIRYVDVPDDSPRPPKGNGVAG